MNATEFDTSEKSQRQLAAGVLKQATQDLRRFHGAPSKIEQELYFNAYSWVTSDDRSWSFSFLNVCQLLNLAPENVRQDLLGDLSLGLCSQWARRCSRAFLRLRPLLVQPFASERELSAAEMVKLTPVLHQNEST